MVAPEKLCTHSHRSCPSCRLQVMRQVMLQTQAPPTPAPVAPAAPQSRPVAVPFLGPPVTPGRSRVSDKNLQSTVNYPSILVSSALASGPATPPRPDSSPLCDVRSTLRLGERRTDSEAAPATPVVAPPPLTPAARSILKDDKKAARSANRASFGGAMSESRKVGFSDGGEMDLDARPDAPAAMDTSPDAATAAAAAASAAKPDSGKPETVLIEADDDITFKLPISVLKLPASAAVLAPDLVPDSQERPLVTPPRRYFFFS
jgi:hypothetical protein